jgi:hypothetical protein
MNALDSADRDVLDGVHLVDTDGRAQWLTAVYRRTALRTALADGDGLAGDSMRGLVAALRLSGIADAARTGTDIDTWDDLTMHHADATANNRRKPRKTDATRQQLETP